MQSTSWGGGIFARAVTSANFGGVLLATRFLGGKDEERLFLYTAKFDCDDDIVVVQRTDMPNIDHLIARHRGRYCIPAAFCRPGMRVLDFPCGSGYGMEMLNITRIYYEGMDIDKATVEYCNLIYGRYMRYFKEGNLVDPHLEDRAYDLICCIDGLEHIEEKYQERLIGYFWSALKYGGLLVVTTPEKQGETVNPYHKHELTRLKFERLLTPKFRDIQILEIKDEVHTGTKTNLLFGICRKED